MGITRRRAQRRRRAWRNTLTIVFVLTLSLGTYYGLHSPYFEVKRVELDGLIALDEDEVMQWTGLTEPTLLWQVDVATLAARLEAHPRIAGVQVSRRWPDALVVELLERTPLAFVADEDLRLAVDDTGVPFAWVDEVPAGALLITGVELAGQNLGEDLPAAAQGALLCAMYISQFGMDWVEEVQANGEDELALVLTGGFPVRLGSANARSLPDQLAVLEALWAQWQAQLDEVIYFDVSNAQRPAVKVVQASDQQ